MEHDQVLRKYDNEVKQRYHLLEVTASTANVICTESNFDLAIDKALQIIGEGIDTDRVLVAEYFGDLTDISLLNWKITYEWHSAFAISQINHPEAAQGSYEGIEEWYEILSSGQSISYRLDEMPEPFRGKQAQVGVKVLHAVPIIVDEKQWGVLVINDCRQETYRGRAELNILKTAAACIGGAIEKERIRCDREETEKAILLEREKTALATATQLIQYNQILEQRDDEIQRSYRFLEVAASVANVISTKEDIDLAIGEALQIIGEGIDTDRIAIVENFDSPADFLSKYWKIIYEWDSAYAVSQIDHPEVAQGNYQGIEEWYDTLSNGQSVRCQLAQMLEPFRSKMEKIGVKSTYLIPIMVDGKYWGMVGIDDCHQETYRGRAELNILKTAAACIGGAIEKERSRCAKEEAEKVILLEREKAALEKGVNLLKSNQTLSLRDKWLEATANAANKLLKNADLEEGINAALKVLGESLDCGRVSVMQYSEDRTGKTFGFMCQLYEWNSLDTFCQLRHPKFNQIPLGGMEENLLRVQAGEWVGGLVEEHPDPFRSGQMELGVKSTYAVPIFVGDRFWGILAIDNCREAKLLTSPEISVFKTAASCIGSAIYRQQIQQDKELAELAILDERNRMAREIHDTLAQAFTGISLQLEAARSLLLIQPEAAQERLVKAKNLAKEGIIEARRSVRALRPETLEYNDLASALQQLVDNMTSATDIEAQVIIKGESQLSPVIEVDLFRIAQEAITNTLRHAQAKELTVSLICKTNTVSLQVKDNGVGFDPQQPLNNSFGLIGMQERCDRHNGNLAIDSSGDRGTKIIASIPI